MRIVSLLATFALLCGCSGAKKVSGPRILQLSISADEEFRARPGWEKLLRARVERISEAWERQLGIRWAVAVVNPWASDNNAEAEVLRASLRGGSADGTSILLGVSGQAHNGYSLGFVAPFTKVLIVYDFAQQSESENTAILSHQLARLFGAWDVADRNSVMHAHPTTLDFDRQTIELIRLTRDVDFQASIGGMNPSLLDAVARMYGSTKADLAQSPVFLAHARAGEELLASRNIEPALTELRKAVAIQPDDARLHGEIAAALVSINEIPSAIKEFREVVRIQPLSAAAHANLGSLLTRTGNWREGNVEARKAVDLQPNDPEMHFTLGSVLLHTPGQLDSGIAEVRLGLRLRPGSALGMSLLQGAEQARARVTR